MFNYSQITQFRSIPTPFYYYDMDLLEETLALLSSLAGARGVKVHYAVKANANLPILQAIRKHGFGADCVSGNEVLRSLEAGFAPRDIVFAGVGKTDAEIELGLRQGIGCFNVESLHELEVIHSISRRLGTMAPVAFRINPDLDGRTHRHITTGTRFDKFGMPESDIPELLMAIENMHGLRFEGLHFHIGSQILDMDVFRRLAARVNTINAAFREKGHPAAVLNLGGGLGIDYEDPDRGRIADYSNYFDACLDELQLVSGQQVRFELGRSVVGQCGSLITKVLYLKQNGNQNFAIVDAGMNDLIRPALYQAAHRVQALTSIGPERPYQVVGPICESSDAFGRDILMPELTRGDLLAIRSAGAYGETMSSGYNLRGPAGVIYSSDLKRNAPSLRITSET